LNRKSFIVSISNLHTTSNSSNRVYFGNACIERICEIISKRVSIVKAPTHLSSVIQRSGPWSTRWSRPNGQTEWTTENRVTVYKTAANVWCGSTWMCDSNQRQEIAHTSPSNWASYAITTITDILLS